MTHDPVCASRALTPHTGVEGAGGEHGLQLGQRAVVRRGLRRWTRSPPEAHSWGRCYLFRKEVLPKQIQATVRGTQ